MKRSRQPSAFDRRTSELASAVRPLARGRPAGLAIMLALGCQGSTSPPAPAPAPAPTPSPTPTADIASVIERAATWMATFPADRLRFDAAIGLHALRSHHDTDSVRRAYATARTVADGDGDNPLRRAFDDTSRVPARTSAGWAMPAPGARVNVNRIVGEALHCAENGLRPEAITYAAGAMRDHGGYQTTHALWALTIARDRACLDDFASVARPLIDELRASQPPAPTAEALAVDLFAERLLMLELAGEHGPQLDAWTHALVRAQAGDGGFGQLAQGEDPYHRYHATLVAAWALAIGSRAGGPHP